MIFFKPFYVSVFVISILSSGCVLQSRQLNALLDLLSESPENISANSWTVRYSNYESIVYAVSTSEGILFSNNSGDQILFDGWALRKIRGMGQSRLNLNIDDDGTTRTFRKGNIVVSSHSCDPWQRQKNLELLRYFQVCSDKQEYKNSILVQNDGDISVIRQIVDERYTALMLTKLK